MPSLVEQLPLTDDEGDGLVIAVRSTFDRLRNVYLRIAPLFAEAGFKPPSPGALARDISEKIQTEVVSHCPSFSRGPKFVDLARAGFDWEVKIKQKSGFTINGCHVAAGETYLAVNYTADVRVVKIFVLWHAAEEMFSARTTKAQARAFLIRKGGVHVQVLFSAKPERKRRPPEPDDLFGPRRP
jgi:hypothetical protein